MSFPIELIKKNAPLLSTLTISEIMGYLKDGEFRIAEYKKDSVLHFEGEHCTKLELILSGKVVVDHITESGDLLTVAGFVSGDTLGGNILFSTNPYYPLTVVTQLPSVVLEIDNEVLFTLCCQNPLLLRTFLEHLSDHAFILGDKIKYYVKKTIRESVLNFLQQERKWQKSNPIQLNMTKKALAERMGVQRTSLSRELAKMQKDGLILVDRDMITLL